MKKIYILSALCLMLIIVPILLFAQSEGGDDQITENNPTTDNGALNQEIFNAKILEIIDQQTITDENNTEHVKQKLKLQGLNGNYEGKVVIYDGMKYNFLSDTIFRVNDKIRMQVSVNSSGEKIFYIEDIIRTNDIYLLIIIFIIITIVVGRLKGLTALIGLGLSFVVILKIILPLIVAGYNPLIVTIIGSILIMIVALYIVHGFNKKTTAAIIGTSIGLIVIGLVSWIFTEMTRLTGTASEESLFIADILGKQLNMKGVLLAGMIIGALGVLDDITIGQASSVQQIHETNPALNKKEVYKRAMRVGIDHVGSIVNTLFLAYAGASMSLLLLFQANQPPFTDFEHIINHAVISEEIVRAVCGSIGLILVVPITTLIAVFIFIRKK
ncbi:MAG: YibE/F family protein [Patescibacteria group bacterium]